MVVLGNFYWDIWDDGTSGISEISEQHIRYVVIKCMGSFA